jgi:uncharacterized protein (DUF58 family)
MYRAEGIANWLEARWVTPAYSGWLLSSLSVFFFIAATNTMAGWLYALSGIGMALLAIAAILPERNLRRLVIQRSPVHPVSVGDQLTIELLLQNPTSQPKSLLQVQDMLPYVLGKPATLALETIPAHGSYSWVYFQPAQRRGIYHWSTVQLRTAAPLGLFWCRRNRDVRARATVYPTVLPLSHCPLVDEMGSDPSPQYSSDRRSLAATEGITRSLRPYRWGDPTRLVHWRTSARYGELRVRELEIFSGGREITIALDSGNSWQRQLQEIDSESFEQAVTAAASLYFYALHQKLTVQLWTAGTGLIRESGAVLETLAAIQPDDSNLLQELPSLPLIWLTQNPTSLASLLPGSRWILWATAPKLGESPAPQNPESSFPPNTPGLLIQLGSPLESHLQSPLSHL